MTCVIFLSNLIIREAYSVVRSNCKPFFLFNEVHCLYIFLPQAGRYASLGKQYR